ncbi:hypothetical protein EV175_004271, partial [Coemansia sp. RSA 1933]
MASIGRCSSRAQGPLSTRELAMSLQCSDPASASTLRLRICMLWYSPTELYSARRKSL